MPQIQIPAMSPPKSLTLVRLIMVWNQLTDYLKGSLNSLGRALNINNNGNVGLVRVESLTFESWKTELSLAISTRNADNSALVALGRRGFNSEFRFFVKQSYSNTLILKFFFFGIVLFAF